ncbi:hypothetical protein EVAR_83526_1 [Eumeta japonica]|uniref:Uncharacterized protein n=1 Tax=Eumeta variegata TaxID=151549 RepID=A0A4C1ZFJ9_EUMVA|nr:hypothetical protein EVAR_83526_1 [Eumeta japonica]
MGLRRLITEFLWPPSSSIIRPWLPYSISTRQDESNELKLDGVASFNYGVPMATFQLHHQTLVPYSIKVLCQDESNEPKLDGVASFNYGIPMATFWLHHQTLITI